MNNKALYGLHTFRVRDGPQHFSNIKEGPELEKVGNNWCKLFKDFVFCSTFYQ